ncbi:Recombinase [Agrobacterium tumefaciens]|nr:Recombinase [Agrobacterium tumefaciens]
MPVAFYSLDIFDRIAEKMVAHETSRLKSTPSRREELAVELATVKSKQAGLMQQIQNQQAEGRPRLAILDDQLDELEVTREKLVCELAGAAEEPVEDFQVKIAKLKAQFNPANTEIANIMASMDVIDIMQQQFVASAQNDMMARIASGEIDKEAKREKLLKAYAEELLRKSPEWENLQVSVVAGAGFEPAAFRL